MPKERITPKPGAKIRRALNRSRFDLAAANNAPRLQAGGDTATHSNPLDELAARRSQAALSGMRRRNLRVRALGAIEATGEKPVLNADEMRHLGSQATIAVGLSPTDAKTFRPTDLVAYRGERAASAVGPADEIATPEAASVAITSGQHSIGAEVVKLPQRPPVEMPPEPRPPIAA